MKLLVPLNIRHNLMELGCRLIFDVIHFWRHLFSYRVLLTIITIHNIGYKLTSSFHIINMPKLTFHHQIMYVFLQV